MKLFVFGISGKMGRAVAAAAAERGHTVVGGFDLVPHETIPTYKKVSEIDCGPFDAVIDFSRPSSLGSIVELCTSRRVPAVIASTGFSEADERTIEQLAQKVAVLRSGNMSVGVNLMLELVERAAEAIADGFDIEIVEKHHNMKADAPSGTALMLADAVKRVKTDGEIKYGRSGPDSKRGKNDITVHSVRGGTIVGEHEVIFAGNDEIITVSHTALSRKIFAVGALKAAEFLLSVPPALYTMRNVLNK